MIRSADVGSADALSPSVPSTRRTDLPPGVFSTVGLLLAAYLGATFALPPYLTINTPFVNSYFLASCVAGLLGWVIRFKFRPIGMYIAAAVLFAFFVAASAVSYWDLHAMYVSMTVAVWVLFVIPGVAFLLADPKRRRMFVFALGCGMATYGFLRAFWLLIGYTPPPTLMLRAGNGTIWWFLRSNRDEIDAIALMTVPLLFLRNEGYRIWGRRTLCALIVFWLLTSGGRAGPVFLGLMGIFYLVIVPGFFRRIRSMAVVVVIGAVAFAGSQLLGEHSEVGRDRVELLLSGERTVSDEQRDILNLRAWNLGWDNPIFGHGYLRLLGTYDPVLNRARTFREARKAQREGIHNLYLWWFQTIGVPGTVGYLAMWGIVLVFLLRFRGHHDARMAATSYVSVLASIGFHTAHQDLPYFSLAVSLAVLAGLQRPTPKESPADA
jgi:O-antigen ligase